MGDDPTGDTAQNGASGGAGSRDSLPVRHLGATGNQKEGRDP
jgi:hypothetical protein